jgi:transposase InsO family protein
LLDILKHEGKLEGEGPHRATLDRHLARRGASRRQMKVLGEKRTIKMRFDRFGDLWVGDYHHGPLVLAPDGRAVVAKLGGIIDHCTRYPVADRYYLSEDLLTLRDCSLRAFLRFGLPKRYYVDRGAVYRAEQLAWSLARVGSHLIHSRAYYSQGRGVIERWWQCADAFENEVRARDELLTIHELNCLWEAWRELRYCSQVHSDLGRTPNEAIAGLAFTPIDPAVADELFLVREDRTVHRKDGCVSVEGRRFLCDSHLRGQKVQVRYDPRDLSWVLIFQDGQRVQKALPQPINATPEPHPEEPVKVQQSVDYLAMLREDFDRRLLMQARPLAYAELRTDPAFDANAFLGVLTGLAGLTPSPSEDKEARAFWDTFGPLPETLVRTAVEHAVRMHARGRHVRLYLNAIQTLVLAHWRNPKEPS